MRGLVRHEKRNMMNASSNYDKEKTSSDHVLFTYTLFIHLLFIHVQRMPCLFISIHKLFLHVQLIIV